MSEFKNEVLEVNFQIKRIKQISFFVREELHKKADPATNVNMAYKIEYNIEKELLSFTVRISFIYPKENLTYIEAEVQNVFELKDLKRFFEGENAKLPSELLIAIVSLSLTHTRAIVATNVAGTVYNDILLPLFDSRKVAFQFFGDSIETANPNLNTGI